MVTKRKLRNDSTIRRTLGHRDCKNQDKEKIEKPPENNVRYLAKKSNVREKKIRKIKPKIVARNKINLTSFIPTLPEINVTADEIATYTEMVLLERMHESIEELSSSGFPIDVDEYGNSIDTHLKKYSKRSLDFVSQRILEENDPFDALLDEFKGDIDEFKLYKSQFITKPKKVRHITWCCKCGKPDNLINCKYCCIAFHRKCHNSSRKTAKSTQKLRPSVAKIKRDLNVYCPQCKSGDILCNGDIVWHKLKGFSWWPARILALRDKPKCLVYPPTSHHFPVFYYGSKNYAWADIRQMFSFSLNHDELLNNKTNELLQDAIEEASEDFICTLG